MEIGTRVKNTETGKMGVVVSDPYGCCADFEVPIVYDGETSFSGTDKKILEDLGPEDAKPDMKKCGAGRQEECCIFLTMGGNGWECQRHGSLRNTLIFQKSKMTAKREPSEPYPKCQLEPEQAQE